MEIKAFEIVKSYRDKAIAVLRLQKVNELVEELQALNGRISTRDKATAELNAKRTEVAAGSFSPSLEDVRRFGSAAEAKDETLKQMDATLEENGKAAERDAKAKEELETKIRAAATGGEGYKFNRETITKLAAELIKQDGVNLSLEDVASVGDESSAEEFVPAELNS